MLCLPASQPTEMFAFVTSAPLIRNIQATRLHISCNRRTKSHAPLKCTGQNSEDYSEQVPKESHRALSLHTLPSFEAFCWRAQQTLCEHTAQADGLGTFQSPMTFPSTAQEQSPSQNQAMQGGRKFLNATIDVFRNRPSRPRTRRLLTTVGPVPMPSPNERECAGLSLNLRPRDPDLPSLRASVHYFQIGGACVTWWFAGSADLCMSRANSNRFRGLSSQFQMAWSTICHQYAVSARHRYVNFMQDCLCEDGIRTTDREICFSFVADVVDQLLPTYLPLLDYGKRTSSVRGNDGWPFSNLAREEGVSTPLAAEVVDIFPLQGGAACESVTVTACPLASWRFSLSPSTLTAAGKEYVSLQRNGENGANSSQSFLYI